ncbi:MAG: hypothetical protein IJM59_12280 [Proteobacteria bacterium]|nr:hypothetical protein [Pseudomonadota bacterium]
MKKTWIVMAMLAALSMTAACNDDKDEPNCVEGTSICDQNAVRYTCTNDNYVLNPCSTGTRCDQESGKCLPVAECTDSSVTSCNGNILTYCSNGKTKMMDCSSVGSCGVECIADDGAGNCLTYSQPRCIAATTACTEGESRCSAAGVRQICQLDTNSMTNIWVDFPCATSNGEFCRSGACVQCEDEEKRCGPGNTAQICIQNAWTTKDVCNRPGADVCDEGICKDSTACDYDGAVRCSDKTPQVCNNGKWESKAACSTACLDGACVECTDNVCVKDAVKYCVNGHFLISDADIAKCINGDYDKDEAKKAEICVGYDDCAADELFCKKTSFDGSTCVYKGSDLEQKSEGTIPLEGLSSAGTCGSYGAQYGLGMYLKCEKIDNELYCGTMLAQSICQKDGDKIKVLACNGSKIAEYPCAKSCQMLSSITSAPNFSSLIPEAVSSYDVAVCDEKIISSTGANGISNLVGGGSDEGGNKPGPSGVSCPYSGYEVCDADCALQSGGTCIDYCKSQGSNICCMDSTSIYCEDPNGGSGGKDEWVACTADNCKVTGGQTCIDACKERYQSDECFMNPSTNEVACEDPNGGGGGGNSGASCDVYDCTAQYGEQCKSQFQVDHALCDGKKAYCLDRLSDKDSTCKEGETAWDNDGEPICLTVGSDVSCLSGGGSSGGDDGDYIDCGAEDCSGDGSYTCNDVCTKQNSAFQAYCFEYSGKMYVGCGLTCTKEGEEAQLCGTDSTGSYTYPAVCAKVGSKLIQVDAAEKEDDYTDCATTCDDAGTACK